MKLKKIIKTSLFKNMLLIFFIGIGLPSSRNIDDAEIATALNYNMQHIQIYSCSWGPKMTTGGHDKLTQRALYNGAKEVIHLFFVYINNIALRYHTIF